MQVRKSVHVHAKSLILGCISERMLVEAADVGRVADFVCHAGEEAANQEH